MTIITGLHIGLGARACYGHNYDYLPCVSQLNSLKVADLKVYMKTVGLELTGRKQDLIDSISEHLGV